MNKNIISAVLLSFSAAAAFLLSLGSPGSTEAMFGYATVLVLLALATVEYRINWKRIFARN